ncbi:hypothetical protein GIB67_003019, partial [Kingdonia uniflora]
VETLNKIKTTPDKHDEYIITEGYKKLQRLLKPHLYPYRLFLKETLKRKPKKPLKS